nr:hypothetical protein [uncultured Rhodopila sp.]
MEAADWNGGHVGRKAPNPFIVNHIHPARVDQTIYRDLNNDIFQMKRVKNAGIQHDDARLKRHKAAGDPPRRRMAARSASIFVLNQRTRLPGPSLIAILLASKITRTPRNFGVFPARNGLSLRR